MKKKLIARWIIFTVLLMTGMTSCLNLEEEPILLVNPSAELSAHVKDQKIFATALVNVNAQVLFAGNIPTRFEVDGELAIYDTDNGRIIDVRSIDNDEGLAQTYTVSADTAFRERFIVIASGSVSAYADVGDDGSTGNDKLLSQGDFYQEAQFVVAELLRQ
jgi:hypothetical protein